MCQPRKWWWGLLPLAALWAGSVFVLTPQIEEELAHRVVTAVRKDMPWAKTLIEGRDIYIEGAAPSEEARHNVVNAVLETDGVRLAINTAGLIPEAKPFTWSASRDATKLTLSGYVAPDGSREKIAAEARKLVPNAAIVDDMKEARGAPAGAVAMTAAALAALARLRAGSVALVDTTLAIKGTAPDQATVAAINAAARKLPPPMQLASVDVTAPPAAAPPAPKAPAIPTERPYVWQGMRDGNVVTLTGFVPSDAARTQVLAAAKSTLGGGRVVDQMKLAVGLPSSVDFGAASGFALIQLGQMRNGTAKLTDGSLAIEGEALDVSAYRAVTAATAAALPAGLKLDRAALTPPRVGNYTWTARREGKSLALSGYYPDEATRVMMGQAVTQRFADLKVDDRTSIASGAPAGFSAAMGMALDQLSRLESGEATIAGGQLTISGVAPEERIANEIKDALTKLVGGMPAQSKVTFVPPPPSPPPVAAAPAAAPPAPVIAAAPSAPVAATPSVPAVAAAPPVPPAAAPPSVPVAAATPPAPVATTPPTVTATPTPTPTPTPPAVGPPAVATAKQMPTPVAPVTAIPAVPPAVVAAPAAPSTAPKPAEPASPPAPVAPKASQPPPAAAVAAASCPNAAGAAVDTGRVRFRSSKTGVSPSARKTIAGIAGMMKRCSTLKIEVAGHTDSTGSEALNERLSKARAEAIRAMLVRQGVEAARIRTAGYGAAKPVADNVTPAGKAQNRRIEFVVVE